MESFKILIVEDDLVQRKRLEQLLGKNGYSIVSASSCSEALSLFSKSKFDFYLIDIILSSDDQEMNGVDLAKILVASSNVPLVFLSACKDKFLIKKTLDLKPEAFLIKPCTDDQILMTLKRVLYTNSSKKLINKQFSDDFYIRDKDYFQRINIGDIEKIEADKGVIHLFTNYGKKFTISLCLKQFAEQFPFPTLQRVNRSCIINLTHLKKFNQNYVWINGSPIVLGENYKKDFYDKIRILKTGWKTSAHQILQN
jgi:DNA-binding LytR/AlgR family response regulator